jgi:hypothetical protein
MVAVATVLAVSISHDNARLAGDVSSASRSSADENMLSEQASPLLANLLTAQQTPLHLATDQYTPMGSGGCRTMAVDAPPAIQLSAESLADCFAHCNADSSCTAVEWVHGDTQCHLHGEGIVRSAGGESVTACYRRHVSKGVVVIVVDQDAEEPVDDEIVVIVDGTPVDTTESPAV